MKSFFLAFWQIRFYVKKISTKRFTIDNQCKKFELKEIFVSSANQTKWLNVVESSCILHGEFMSLSYVSVIDLVHKYEI